MTVDYVVRDGAGSVQSGSFAEGDPSTIYVSYSKDVSLNLNASDVANYSRHGSDLLVTLENGQVLVLSGYYDEGATGDKNLFLSDEGNFIEVVLEDGADGALYASYDAIDVSGKWSAYDQMVFLDIGNIEQVVAPLAAAPLLGPLGLLGGGAAAAGAAALAGGGGGGDDGNGDGGSGGGGGGNGGTEVTPTVDDPTATHLVGGTGPDSATITGTGEPGAAVTVTVGTSVQNVVVDANGKWTATFDPLVIPADGVHNATVQVVNASGKTFDLSGPTLDIDTTPPTVTITDGTESTGDMVNGASHAGGATIVGTGEAGATVEVTIAGTTHTTTVDANGDWSVTFAQSEVAAGEYKSDISIKTTDARGNSSTSADVLVVDTVAPPIGLDVTEGDDLINKTEASDGVTLAGTGEVGATISLEFQGITRTATVDANGQWSIDFAASEVKAGTYDAPIEITSTDAAGNSSTSSHTVRVDTEQAVVVNTQVGTDNAINATEQAAGVNLTGTAQAGSSVAVTMGAVTHTVQADASGNWNATFTSAEIPTGTYDAKVTAVATDAAGNTAATSGTILVDTKNSVDITPGFVGADNILNGAEAAAGVTFTGKTEAGVTNVVVNVAGVSRTATVDANGNWSATYGPGALTQGEYDTKVEVTSTDAVGNVATASSNFRVDTTAGTVEISTNPVEIDDVINGVERGDGVVIKGTATPGLTVTVGLGAASQDVVADANGNWSTNFPASSIPVGTKDLPVTATITDGAGNTASDTDSVKLDTHVDNFAQAAGKIEGDDIINHTERADGVTLTGTVEAGSTVEVKLGNATQTASVDGNGNWTVTFAAGSIPPGTYDAPIVVTATDPAGNVETLNDTVAVDTTAALAVEPKQTADDTINAAERTAGVTLNGTAEAGSVVTIKLQGVTQTVTADGSGNWTSTFDAATLPEGTYQASATITAKDPAGNETTLTETFNVDTQVATPDVDSVTFVRNNVARISTQDVQDSYEVRTLESNGSVGTPQASISKDPVFGTEFTFNSPIPDGTNLIVNRTDSAGNKASTLMVMEDNATSISHAGLAGFDVEALNLEYSADTNLTLTEADIKGLSAGTDTLTIHGGTDDTITVAGAVKTTQTQQIDGQTYDVYTIGNDGATLIIEQDVTVMV